MLHLHFLALQVERQVGSFLEGHIHLKYVIGRREHHVASVLLVGQYHRLEHVHNLRNVGHADAVGVPMEHVERQSGYEGIAQGVLLIEVAGDGARLLVPPCSPFVDQQRDLLLRVFLVHDGLVLLDDILNLQTLAQRPVVVVAVES